MSLDQLTELFEGALASCPYQARVTSVSQTPKGAIFLRITQMVWNDELKNFDEFNVTHALSPVVPGKIRIDVKKAITTAMIELHRAIRRDRSKDGTANQN